MPGQGQSERRLGLIAGEPGGRIEHTLQRDPLRQVFGSVAGQLASNALQLLLIGQAVLQYHEELF